MLMPGILLLFAKGIDRSHHRCYVPNITFAGKLANKTKYIIPPLFVLVLVFAFLKSNNCQYIYDTSSVESAKKSESKIAPGKKDQRLSAFPTNLVMVPRGGESEEGALKEIEKLDYVDSVLGGS